jgi:hypothetical protein
VRARPDGTADRDATTALRRELRAQRLGREPAEVAVAGLDELARADGEPTARTVVAGACRLCGAELGDDWLAEAQTRDTLAVEQLATMGIRVRPNETVRVREHLCPSCGYALDVRVETTS